MFKFFLAFIAACGLMFATASAQAAPFLPGDFPLNDYQGSWVKTDVETINLTYQCSLDVDMYLYDIQKDPFANDAILFDAPTSGLLAVDISVVVDQITGDVVLTTPLNESLNLGSDGLFGFYFLANGVVDFTYDVTRLSDNQYTISDVDCDFTLVVDARPDDQVTAPIPLPGAAWLLIGGLMSLLGLRRKA